MTDQNQATKALSQAAKLEKEGREFYLKAAEQVANEEGRTMFLSLADDEKDHLEMVERQLHEVESEGSYVLLPDLDVEGIDVGEDLFPVDPADIKAETGVDPSQAQVLHVALDKENESYNLYRQAAQDTEDPAGQRMYLWLMNAERTHFNLLMSNYETLAWLGGRTF